MEKLKSDSENQCWHVIYVRPKFERKVFATLLERGVESYLPLKKVVRQWRDRKKKMEVPVFPGYVFVKINRKEIANVYSTNGAIFTHFII